MREGFRVRITSGEYKGKIGKVIIGPLPMSQVQDLAPGQDISMEGAKILWVIQLDEGGKQTILEESELETIPPE